MDYAKLEDALGCPFCNEIAVPPIYLCPRGHVICHCGLGEVCQTCWVRLPFDKVRSIPTEKLLEGLEVQCKNAASGCKVLSKGGELAGHLRECKFRESNWCEIFQPSCHVTYPPKDFESHFHLHHKESFIRASESEKRFKILQNISTGQLSELGGSYLPCVITVPNGFTYILLTTVTSRETRLLTWQVIVRNGNGRREDFLNVPLTVRSPAFTMTWDFDPSTATAELGDEPFSLLGTFALPLDTLFLDRDIFQNPEENLGWELIFNFPEKRLWPQ